MREWLEGVLFPSALELQQTAPEHLDRRLLGKRLFYLFYEASTRTRVLFEMAVTLLGGTAHGIDSHEPYAQDERLEDRIRVLNEYPHDFLLIRYDQEGGASRAAAVSRVPVINAGDGQGQHPTQALLDAIRCGASWGASTAAHRAATDGVLMALASEVLPRELRTTGLSLLTSATALGCCCRCCPLARCGAPGTCGFRWCFSGSRCWSWPGASALAFQRRRISTPVRT